LVEAAALASALLVHSARHSAELRAQAATFNVWLGAQDATFHAQIKKEFDRHNAQLSGETLPFNVRLIETAVQYSELAAEGACPCFDSSAKRLITYLASLNTFADWCIETGRLTLNPFKIVARADERADCGRQRGSMTEAELVKRIPANMASRSLPVSQPMPDCSPCRRNYWSRFSIET
jgi:hypothetical protein